MAGHYFRKPDPVGRCRHLLAGIALLAGIQAGSSTALVLVEGAVAPVAATAGIVTRDVMIAQGTGAAAGDDAGVAAGTMPAATEMPSLEAQALSRFDDSFLAGVEGDPALRSIGTIIREIEELEKGYLEDLQDARSSYGLYAVGSWDHDALNTERRYAAGLEWRLFNDGYVEAVRSDSLKVLQTRLEFYQMREDMIARKLDEDLYVLSGIENLVNRAHAEEKAAVLETLLAKRKTQLQHGYTTALDVLNLERQLADARQGSSFYRGEAQAGLSREQQGLLNDLERLQLKPASELAKIGRERSGSLQIQDNFIERAEFFPAWIDDLAVDLEAGHSREYSEEERNTVGFTIEIPLSLNTERSSLVETQKRIYRYQKEAVQRRLQQQTERLGSLFRFQQQRLLAQQQTLQLLARMRETDTRREGNSIQKFEDDPARSRELLTVSIIDARYESLRIRLAIYEVILKLLALTREEDVTALFAGG
ncbi:MAG: hypothetical protein F9K32_06625 [Desulfobulbaceae bacterium]|nr:MAG: hypothetical protein F9K32_06625 [Desulfobulbaceae bacterium]